MRKMAEDGTLDAPPSTNVNDQQDNTNQPDTTVPNSINDPATGTDTSTDAGTAGEVPLSADTASDNEASTEGDESEGTEQTEGDGTEAELDERTGLDAFDWTFGLGDTVPGLKALITI